MFPMPLMPSSRSTSYVLFSIGNIKPLFQAVFPSCWGKPPKGHHAICDPKWIAAVDYMEIVGIIVGKEHFRHISMTFYSREQAKSPLASLVTGLAVAGALSKTLESWSSASSC